MTKRVAVFADDTYFASVHWELFYLIFFGEQAVECETKELTFKG
jgi:hypothetical protein